MVNRKGQQGVTLGLLATFAVIFVVAVMTSSISARILERVQDANIFPNTSTSYNLTNQGIQGLQQWASFYPITGLIIIGSVAIGLLLAFR